MTLGSGGPHAESAMVAFTKRKAQMERWKESETHMESPEIRNRPKRVKFADKCIFQAACASNDKTQVARMIQDGYDINAVDEDGITALHQACIEDNFDMVEFLLQNGADVNISDNEGWTPLHAVATCCYVSIARLLLEHGANVVALNNDCNIPIDICKSDEIRELFKQDIAAKGIDLGEARRGEELKMMDDAKSWLASGAYNEEPHPTTGATALHVAACKGYIKVLEILLKAGADINAKDFDGWTPLHAAAHWGQEQACRILLENICDINIKNNCDQTAMDVADTGVLPILQEVKSKQDANKNIEPGGSANILPLPPKKKISKAPEEDSNIIAANKMSSSQKVDKPVDANETGSDEEVEANEAADTVGELPSTEIVEPVLPLPTMNSLPTQVKTDQPEQVEIHTTDMETSEKDESGNPNVAEPSSLAKRKNEAADVSKDVIPVNPSGTMSKVPSLPPVNVSPSISKKEISKAETIDDTIPSWRRGGSLRTRTGSRETPTIEEGQVDEKSGDRVSVRRTRSENATDTNLRRAYSFESDSRFYTRLTSARNRIKAIEAASAAMNSTDVTSLISSNSNTANRTTTTTTTSSNDSTLTTTSSNQNNNYTNTVVCSDVILRRRDPDSRTSRPTTISTSSPEKRPVTNANVNQIRRSFVPPTRDEESETQRKAHAKRVRETRRSTQGVTLEELKSAEQYVKTQQSSAPTSTVQVPVPISSGVPSQTPSASTTASIRKEEDSMERRPSWRLRVDDSDRSKFSLEDTRSTSRTPSSKEEVPVPRSPSSRNKLLRESDSSSGKPPLPPEEAAEREKVSADEEKDKDSKNCGAQGAILRKKHKQKRRSTGVVQYSADDPEGQDSIPSDSEVGSRRSSAASSDVEHGPDSRNENGLVARVNYRKLYEETLKENQLLKSRLNTMEEQITDLRLKLERTSLTQRITPDDTDKREKRALERKLSEMEEELKETRHLKTENQKLRDENGALIRVISKLSK